MADYPALPLWTDAYLADTTHLTDAEHGRYCLMLFHLWRTPGRRFPNDNRWLARKFKRSENDIIQLFRPLIEEFFENDGNTLRQKRIDREFARLQMISKRQSARAKTKWDNENGPCSAGTADDDKQECIASPAMEPQPQPQPQPEPKDLSVPTEPHPFRQPRNGISVVDEAHGDFNEIALKIGLPQCRKLTPDRRSKLKLRLGDIGGLANWNAALAKIEHISGMRGANDRGWIASIDFLLRPGVLLRILEGAYDNWDGRNKKPSKTDRTDAVVREYLSRHH